MKRSFSLARAVLAGLAGTAAMTILMYAWPLAGLPSMDIMAALGSALPFNVSPYVMGSLIHFSVGSSLGLIYASFFESWLPGPGWWRGAVFSFVPWLLTITLLGPGLQIASELFRGEKAAAANPCSVSNPCAVRPANPCSVNQSRSNVRAAREANPCAVRNPCAGSTKSPSGPSSEAMSLIVHLLYGAVLGAVYRPSGG